MKATKQIIRENWKNAVRFYFEGTTLSELKECIRMQREKEIASYKEWKIRNSEPFKDKVANILYD